VLLGHIDTVPGDIPVRIEDEEEGPVLYGRGSVDAKGPLAAFVSAVARLDSGWAREQDVRLVVVGAVEEEAATSKGARFIRDRFDGTREPVPAACIIGEPSSWRRVTLGYKGRVLVDMEASQPMAHTAGPDAGVATLAVSFWNWIDAQARAFNRERTRAFDQLLPSLRSLRTWTDEQMHDRVEARSGVRLPLDFDADAFREALLAWAVAQVGEGATVDAVDAPDDGGPGGSSYVIRGGASGKVIRLALRGYEPAWRSDRNNGLVRSFLAAIRGAEAGVRPGFVVKTGTSDMNVVGPAWGCPILAYGPGDSALDHTPDEHISLDEYVKAVRVLEAALRRWAL
jgi:LysW-gamma-L-lysine carboxypeptidase